MDPEVFKYRLEAHEASIKLKFIKMNGKSVRPRHILCVDCHDPKRVDTYPMVFENKAVYINKYPSFYPIISPYIKWVGPHVWIWVQCQWCMDLSGVWLRPEYIEWVPRDHPLIPF